MVKVTKDEFVLLFKELAGKLGRTPTCGEVKSQIKNGNQLLYLHFKSIEELLIAAGHSKSKIKTKNEYEPPKIIHPLLPEADIPIEEVIDSMVKRFGKRKDAHTAKKWMEFKVKTDLPIGICWFGDPHLDDDGCNWPLLKRDIEICKNTEGMFGANIGDTHNNWVGRLMKEYASQETSRGTAFKLVEWFFKDSGVKWLIMLMGNHDTWNFGSETITKIAQNICPMIDWRAQFKLKFKNNVEVLIDAAHDHSGHSQWNSLHGQQKASTMGGVAHLYIAGHRHNWALAQNECSQTGRIYWLARVRGYKEIDDYAEKLGFGSQKSGASVVTIIDPRADEINRVRCFADVAEGAEYLNFVRAKYR